ncbi:hypothetical protein Vadar_001069 [Vaccinium darrowii]|uniref:Uncharacterized protein n=1 Tax=Vaccinium darrowii TaxID=229202 RepID=A0ACB7WWY6_9ERIC|nr:hypothetical protein Vadar_001069 [Vaccinium darrowii]
MMSSLSSLATPYFPTGDLFDIKKENLSILGVNSNSCHFKAYIGGVPSHKNGRLIATGAFPIGKTGYVEQNLPTNWKKVDVHKQGLITEEGGYKQIFAIRSCEVGPDKAATIETILNLLQETSLNHVLLLGISVDGFGGTHGMKRHNLAWVVSRQQVEMECYPGCTLVVMNKETRRLSKMPEEVTKELSPFFIEKRALEEIMKEKIETVNGKAKYVSSDLKPMWSDLDVNYHVNNVKYVKWILERVAVKVWWQCLSQQEDCSGSSSRVLTAVMERHGSGGGQQWKDMVVVEAGPTLRFSKP